MERKGFIGFKSVFLMLKQKRISPIVVTVLAICFFWHTGYAGAANPPAAGKPIKIGIMGPMDIRTGAQMMIAAQIAAEKINVAGRIKIGTLKHPVELVKISPEFTKVTDAVGAVERVIMAEKVDFLVGGIVPEAVSAIQDITADNKTIYISASYAVSRRYVDRMSKSYDRYKYCFTMASVESMDIGKLHLGILDVVSKSVKKTGETNVKAAQMVEKTVGGDAIVCFTKIAFLKISLESTGIRRPSPSASDLWAETAAIKFSNPNIFYTVLSSSGGVIFGKQVAELKVPAIVAGSPASSLIPGKGIDDSVTLMIPDSIPIKITDKNLVFYNEFLKRNVGELCAASTYDIFWG